jgi:hypothetical protein
MHFYMHPYLHKKNYSCKKWVLQTPQILAQGLSHQKCRIIIIAMEAVGTLCDKLGSPGTRTFYTKVECSGGLSPLGEGGLEPVPSHSEG